jgi:hypothetical protein
MTGIIEAETAPLTEGDKLRRELAKELVQSQNRVIAEFARHMTTVSFGAVGVVLGLKEKWVADPAPRYAAIGLGVAIALFLLAGGVSAFAASAFLHRVTLSDYGEIESELNRVVRRRVRLTRAAFAFVAAGAAIAAAIALGPAG